MEKNKMIGDLAELSEILEKGMVVITRMRERLNKERDVPIPAPAEFCENHKLVKNFQNECYLCKNLPSKL